MITLFLINSFIQVSLSNSALEQRKMNLLTQGNIIAGRVAPNLYAIEKEHTRLYLERILVNLSLELESRVMIIGVDGKVLMDSYEDYAGKDLSGVREVAGATGGNSEVNQYRFLDVGRVVYVGVPVLDKGSVIGSILMVSSLEEIFEEVKSTMRQFFLLSLLAIILTGIVSFFFADIIATPVERLTEVVRGVTQGRTDLRADEEGQDELARLAVSFNQMITRLEQIDHQRKQFVSNVSHELRTPLSSIKILSETLLHNPTVKQEMYQEFLVDINTEVDRLNNIINSLLYLVDLEKEGMKLDYSLTYLNWLIRNVVAFLRPLAQQKNIALAFEEMDECQIYFDKERIQQCLINIIANGIKFTPEGGSVKVRLYQERDAAVIEVADTGIGIPAEKLPLIFDRFYRVDEARARNTGGSGLGLSISQQIINLHGGRIEVSSERHKGTRFIIQLPILDQSPGGVLT